jgi:hypothetical protein
MKFSGRSATLIMAVCLSWHAAAFASEDAHLYFVHGVPGRDVATANEPTLPVDVLVNDESCYLRGFSFGSVNGPLTLPPGRYDVKISPANTLAPCTNEPYIDSTVALGNGQNITAVLALNDSDTLVLSTFPNDYQSVAAAQARLSVDYAGGNSPIVLLVKLANSKTTLTYTINPGAEQQITLPAGDYTIEATLGGATLAIETIGLPQRSVYPTFCGRRHCESVPELREQDGARRVLVQPESVAANLWRPTLLSGTDVTRRDGETSNQNN